MALVVNTNVTALIAHRRLQQNASAVQQSMERLASGFRINHASDDAAGLTISENLKGSIRGGQKALQNAQDGISILQISEGALDVINDNLQRIRELVVQGANDTNSQPQRDAIAREIRARIDDCDRIANGTKFNGIGLLDGSVITGVGSARLQIGSTSSLQTDTLDISKALATATSTAISFWGGTIGSANDVWDPVAGTSTMTTGTIARNFLDYVTTAINAVTSRLSQLGSLQNQLESVTTNLQSSIENFSASNSRIRDLDVASESSKLVQNQILQQAAVNILGQANQIPQLTLSLLKQ